MRYEKKYFVLTQAPSLADVVENEYGNLGDDFLPRALAGRQNSASIAFKMDKGQGWTTCVVVVLNKRTALSANNAAILARFAAAPDTAQNLQSVVFDRFGPALRLVAEGHVDRPRPSRRWQNSRSLCPAWCRRRRPDRAHRRPTSRAAPLVSRGSPPIETLWSRHARRRRGRRRRSRRRAPRLRGRVRLRRLTPPGRVHVVPHHRVRRWPRRPPRVRPARPVQPARPHLQAGRVSSSAPSVPHRRVRDGNDA